MHTIRRFYWGLAVGRFSAIIFVLFSTSIAFSQTFTILNETTGTTLVDSLDGTAEFRYSVRLTGASSALSGVVPELLPPPCAQEAGQPIFNTTFMGEAGGSQTNLAIPTWSNNQTRVLVFRVHLFNNDVSCGPSTPCGGDDFPFQLRFRHANSISPVSASDPSSHLGIGGPIASGFRVVDVVSETSPSDCAFYVTTIFPSVTYSGFPASLLSDPDIRVFLGVDWNLNVNNNPNPGITFETGLTSFLYPTGSGTNEFFRLKESNVNGGQPLAPYIPQDTVILDQNGVAFPLGPLGGDGPFQSTNDCTLQTWNFFDITDKRPETQAPPPIINHLNNPRAGTFENTVRLNPANNGASFRKAGLYLVRPSGCQASTAFGAPPTQIQFEEYFLNPNGVVEVKLALPSAWTNGSGTQLRSNFTIEWFYRNHTTLSKATRPGGAATASRSLSAELAIPFADASDFVIEARIRRTGTNAIISVQSPGHDLSYGQLNFRTFENAEFDPQTRLFDPDAYLDPGETLVQSLEIENTGSFANNVTLTVGRVIPRDAEFAFSSREKATFFAGTGGSQQIFRRNIPADNALNLDLLFELLRMDNACDDLLLFLEVEYVNQGMNTKFRHEFSVAGDCEIAELSFGLDRNWVDAQHAGSPPCNGSNCPGSSVSTQSPTAGWGFTDPEWVGTPVTRDVFYTLSSPEAGFPIGTDAKIAMNHQATFSRQDAGGIVEYRTATEGSPWSNWQDLILPLETRSAQQLYHAQTFTTTVPGLDNVIGGRDVFMDMSSPQSFDLPLPKGIFSGDKVQFRFLYHLLLDLSAPGTPSPGLWQISDFQYKAQMTKFDDVFGLGENLAFNSCIPSIQLNPEPSGNYTYAWYTSFQDLVDDRSHAISTDGNWEFPIPSSPTNYFVKVQLDNPGTTRYYAMRIDAAGSVPPFSAIINDWQSNGTPGQSDIDLNGQVDVRDGVLQIILDSCE